MIKPKTGVYVAGRKTGTRDMVEVVDSVGNTASAVVNVRDAR